MKGPSRRRVREIALQSMYEIEVGRQDATKVLMRYVKEEELGDGPRSFLRGIIRGTLRYLPQIDGIVEKLSRGWKLERIARVDLSILRLAIFEVLIGMKGEEITDAIIINEAVVLAKKFSSKDSGKFVNGILATLIKEKDEWRKYIHDRRKEMRDEGSLPEQDDGPIPETEATSHVGD
jgi:N utilization substance protein B